MANQTKTRRKKVKRMEQAQAKHDALLEKVEKARAKFQARSEKLRKLETELAELERDFSSSDIADAGKAPDATKKLHTARLIYNPKTPENSEDHSLEAVMNCLRMHGIDAEVTIKTSGKVIRDAARDAVKKGADLVIVAGGDGTIEKVASQLVGSETTLGILPTGTNNNLARALGIPLDLNDACALIAMGVSRKIDVGRVNIKAKAHEKYFLETAGVGLNAIAFPMGQAAQKGRWSDLPNALKKLLDFKPTPILIELDDGQTIQANSQVVTVSNAPLTGMNFLLAPEAKMDDGVLDVSVFDEMNKGDLLGYLVAARNGSRAENPKIKRYKARHVHIHPRDRTPVVSDKDALPEKNDLEIQVLPQSLKVIVGKGMGLTFPVEVAPSVPPLAGPQKTNGHDNSANSEETASTASNGQTQH